MAYDEALADRIRELMAGVPAGRPGGGGRPARALEGWVARGLAHARSLPPKA